MERIRGSKGGSKSAVSPMHRSSPLGYRRNACSPRKRGERGPFSKGYLIVYGGRKKFSMTIHMPRIFQVRSVKKVHSQWKQTSKDFGKEEQVYSLVNGTRAALVRVSVSHRFTVGTQGSCSHRWRARTARADERVVMGLRLKTSGGGRDEAVSGDKCFQRAIIDEHRPARRKAHTQSRTGKGHRMRTGWRTTVTDRDTRDSRSNQSDLCQHQGERRLAAANNKSIMATTKAKAKVPPLSDQGVQRYFSCETG
jgi:hypothetical protein